MSERREYFLGIDVGSVSVNTVAMDARGAILEDHYTRTHGQPLAAALHLLEDIFSRRPASHLAGISITGGGGKLLAELL